MSRSIMITGGLGFIGSNFAHYWKQKYQDDLILVYDAMTYSGNRKNLEPLEDAENLFFVEGDICNFDKVLATIQDYNVNTIVHFATKSLSGTESKRLLKMTMERPFITRGVAGARLRAAWTRRGAQNVWISFTFTVTKMANAHSARYTWVLRTLSMSK